MSELDGYTTVQTFAKTLDISEWKARKWLKADAERYKRLTVRRSRTLFVHSAAVDEYERTSGRPVKSIKEAVRECLENHDIPEEEIGKALEAIDSSIERAFQLFRDISRLLRVRQNLERSKKDRREMRSIRNALRLLIERHPGYAKIGEPGLSDTVNEINERENRFKKAERRWRLTLKFVGAESLEAGKEAGYVNTVVVKFTEALTHLTYSGERWIGLSENQAFGLIAGFLNEHRPKDLPGPDSYTRETVKSRYYRSKDDPRYSSWPGFVE